MRIILPVRILSIFLISSAYVLNNISLAFNFLLIMAALEIFSHSIEKLNDRINDLEEKSLELTKTNFHMNQSLNFLLEDIDDSEQKSIDPGTTANGHG